MSSAAEVDAVSARMAEVQRALDNGDAVRAAALVPELDGALRKIVSSGDSASLGVELEHWSKLMAACLQSAAQVRESLGGRLQQAGAVRSALRRYRR